MIDRSGTTSSTPNTSSTIMEQNLTRKYLLIQNTGGVTIWFNFSSDSNTDQPSIKLDPGQLFIMGDVFVATDKITVMSTGTSIGYTAKEA